ncbi:MAG: CHASE3 domain-containing protein, partial [Gammaproteobacteria bacterium]|nr:CHASE3 domain-containing protein [Gammaproteobacteria bacterium]
MSSVTRQIVLVVLLLAAVLGLFVAAESGQRRLEDASRQVQRAAQRERALADVWLLVRAAESSQRGYILTDNPTYLMPFQEAAGNLPQALAGLEQAYAAAPAGERGQVAEVSALVNVKFQEMRETLEAYRTRGRAAALELMRTDVGMLTMQRIDDRVRSIDKASTADILQASQSWQTRRWVGLATTTAALAASVGLVLLLSRLAVRQLRFRERQAAEHAQRQAELEQLVEQRTAELSELSTHLQSLAEQEKSALSRELHDELGGLLVA